MKHHISLIMIVFFISGCLNCAYQKNVYDVYSTYYDSNPWYILRPVLGIGLEKVDDKVIVTDVLHNALAQGVKKGDMLLKIDDKLIEKRVDILNYILSKKIGDNLTITLYHDGNIKEIPITLERRYFHWLQQALTHLVWSDQTIRIVAVHGEIANINNLMDSEYQAWKDDMWTELSKRIERRFFRTVENELVFSYVSNDSVQAAFNSDTVQEDTFDTQAGRNKLITTFNVTHILQYDFLIDGLRTIKRYSVVEAASGATLDSFEVE
ncbi:PDZ domain-containing protein [candidate division KSB1 bacterium]|nr:PDZ domain-containing protein [candidate division KSB1 bacterium]